MASSTAVDPRQLLNALSSLLTPKGEIKDEDHVEKILSFMKSSRKLVSKCIYMNIIRATHPKEVLMKFVECGGWEMINHWLHEGLENEHNIVVIEIMKVLKHLPVTVDILKKNDTAKTIKQLSKNDGNELQPNASDLVDSWMKVIKHSPGPEKPVKKRKFKLKKEESNGNSSEKKPVENVKKEPEKTEVKKVGKLKITQIKSGKPVAKLKDDNSPTNSKTFDPPKPKKAKVSGPAHAKLRSTGLEQATPLPKMRIKKKVVNASSTSDKKLPTTKREGPVLDKLSQPVEKKVKQELDNNNDTNKPKVLTKPNKVHTVHESAGFMDALLAPPTAPIRRKPKKPPVKPISPKGGPKNPFDVTESTAEPQNDKDVKTEAPKIRFYSAGTTEDEETNSTNDNKSETKKKKKSVRWKADENLVSFHYFELDESERVNVNKVSNFADAKRLERESEKEALMSVKKVIPNEDEKSSNGTIEYMPWQRPIMIYLQNAPAEVVCNSQEKETQRQREMAVLQVLFFDKASLPDTPMEPDPEILEPSVVKRIPLEDESNAEEISDPNMAFDPNADYDANVAYDMNGQPYDPNAPYDPNQMEVGDPNAPSTYDNVHQVLSSLMNQGHDVGGNIMQEEGLTSKLKEIMDTLKGGGPPRMPFNPNNPGGFMRPPPRGRGGLLGNVPMSYRGPHPPRFPPFPPGMGEPRGPPPRGPMRGMRGSRGMRGRGGRGRGGRSEPCWHFMNRGGCRMGSQCHFLHPGINGPPL
ncbi:serine/threonine-protein phosphatase 1 regulatory subunit 10-like isoform X2 [Anneissia japonica]|uniref:serine/threonine-protein phosphatase 1 regulatory subunit 10-like isoform X2 n=1 Tax=Anneissia japonica TaxID=1529436 RepID=UPI0014258E91|nr:serine/threonine-protein phosphatase 1 regulatory subunit 10-like isoform X2 [Anneissia japonica]